MNLSDARILITGATGGIGAATVRQLVARGAAVLLTARSTSALSELRSQLDDSSRIDTCAADLTNSADRERLCSHACAWRGGINTLINNAGVSELRLFETHVPADFDKALAINLVAPVQLCHELLPHLQRQPCAHIVNVGSVMGALGFPGYSVYCATKFGLRGFTESLRRELADTRVKVHYLAPRTTQTSINSAAVMAMNAALGTRVDPPARVAHAVVRLLERERTSAVIGFPEKLFARINQLMPSLIDRALRQQLPIIRRYATAARDSVDCPPSSETKQTRKSA